MHDVHVCWHAQGVRLSSFLETNAAPGQKKLDAFLRPAADSAEGSDAPGDGVKHAHAKHGWKQTFLDWKTRDLVEHHQREFQAAAEARPAAVTALPDLATLQQECAGGSQGAAHDSAAAATACGAAEAAATDAAAARDACGAGAAAPAEGTPPSQGPVELSLREWAPPPTASALLSSQQQPAEGPAAAGSQQAAAKSQHAGEGERSSGQAGQAPDSFPEGVRDILDEGAEEEPDLAAGQGYQHAWDEPPSGLGAGEEEAAAAAAGPSGAGEALGAAKAADPRHWTCQVGGIFAVFLTVPVLSLPARAGAHLHACAACAPALRDSCVVGQSRVAEVALPAGRKIKSS